MNTKKANGFSLIQVLVGMVIGGIVIMAAGQMLTSTKITNQRLTDQVTTTAIATRVKKSLNNIDVLRYSGANGTTPGNIALRNCLDRKAGICDITSPDKQISFQALAPVGSKVFAIAGTDNTSAPVFYSRTGIANCNPKTANEIQGCPSWRVNVFFWAKCGNGAPTCTEATIINVRFQIRPESAIPEHLRIATAPAAPVIQEWPKDSDFNSDPTAYAFAIRVRRALLTGQSCPPGSTAIGYQPNGELNCKCSFGYIQKGLNAQGQPICEEGPGIKCGPTERVVGINTDGSPKCAPVSLKEVCKIVNFGDVSARCDPGWWLRSLNMGQCTAGSGGKKGGSTIECNENKGTCCSEVIK